MTRLIEDNIAHIRALCKNHKVDSFYLFGSAAHGTFRNDSDLDFLVKFSNSIELLDYADNYFDLLERLQLLFKRKVDLVTESSLKNRILIDEINQSKIVLYESQSA